MAQERLLVGCGKMGGAMLQGWVERGAAPDTITVVDPAPGAADQARARFGIAAVGDVAELSEDYRPEIVIFAVKPQGLDAVAPPYRRFAGARTVFLSIAAGKPIRFFEEALGGGAAIVRCMPNTPAAVQRGITAACANRLVSGPQRALCQELLEAVGEVVWVDDEALLDPVTALSGSGPAYVFLMIECLAEAGVVAGLPADIAARLARATVAGSGELARLSSAPADQLRRDVTSPGGTTEAALAVLMAENDGLQQLMTRALEAATARSRDLAG
jgi:pyrroline-5-carboxylate reductase